jgi:hypothetical protein
MHKSPRGKITLKEAGKSGRDAIIVSIGALIPQILEIAGTIDFGEYSAIASLVLAMVAPLLMRLTRKV